MSGRHRSPAADRRSYAVPGDDAEPKVDGDYDIKNCQKNNNKILKVLGIMIIMFTTTTTK